MNDQVVVLTVRSQKASGERIFRLHKKRAVLGSATSSDLRLDDGSVSPIHAILEVSGVDGKPVIYDLASDSGLQVNGATTVQATLNPQDQLQIGPYLITVQVQKLGEIPKTPERVRESFGQKLFVSEKEDLAPLLLENEAEVIDIFDRRPESKTSLQVVMFYNDTILDVEHFVDKKKVLIGPVMGADFPIPPVLPTADAGRFDLVTNESGQYLLHLHEKMEGVVSQNGRLASLKEVMSAVSTAGSKSYRLEDKGFAKVKFGDISFFLNFTPAPPQLKRPKLFEKDPLFLRVWLASLALTALVLVTITSVTVDPKVEIEQLPERVATIIYEPKLLPVERPPMPKAQPTEPVASEKKARPSEPPKVIKVVDPKTPKTEAPKNAMIGEKTQVVKKDDDRPQAVKPDNRPKAVAQKASGQEGAGAKAIGQEGRRGEANKPKAAVAQQKALRPGEGRPTSGAVANKGRSQTNDLGVVDMFKSQQGVLNKLLAGGKGVQNAASKLEGYSGFTSQGQGGLGAAGSGSGGGGQSMGLGGLADKGSGGGKKGSGLGALGSGGNILGGTGKLAIDSGGGSGEPVVQGAIDADAIARELAKYADQIKYCYEKEINAERPDLAGRVGIRFVIGASGSVTSAGVSSTSLKHAPTEGCVIEVIKRIQFPQVRGGGIVEVSRTFVFKPSNK
ncbi:MAG: AgmX/PglI C-terminal domain-containing protein [Bdellovibrionota bacterium]